MYGSLFFIFFVGGSFAALFHAQCGEQLRVELMLERSWKIKMFGRNVYLVSLPVSISTTLYLIAWAPQVWATRACTLSVVPLFQGTAWWQGTGYSSLEPC